MVVAMLIGVSTAARRYREVSARERSQILHRLAPPGAL
jgi:hypothetical protein